MNTTFELDKPIAIGADHAGYELKNIISDFLKSKGLIVKDFGTYGPESVDYPDFAHPVANAVAEGEAGAGILICGSGNGVAITANKHQGIRAALAWSEEIAKLARQHNNANILCLPSRYVSTIVAENMTDIFLHTDFEGGRHEKRVSKIACA
jgi:ribose 5-phosphate isomerase B